MSCSLAFFLMVMSATAATYYVAPTGAFGAAGTIGAPWNLHFALTNGTTVGGDTIFLRGGTYSHAWWATDRTGSGVSRLNGADGNPITVRSYPGETPVILGNVSLTSVTNVTFMGLEFSVTNEPPSIAETRAVQDPKVSSYEYVTGNLELDYSKNLRLINCVIRGAYRSGGFGQSILGAQIEGCLFLNIGRDAADYSSGHALYTQNTTGEKVIKDCIFANTSLSALNIYSGTTTPLYNVKLDGNIVLGGGYGFPYSAQIVSGGDAGVLDMTATNNVLLQWPPAIHAEDYVNDVVLLGYSGSQTTNNLITGNYILGGDVSMFNGWSQVFTNNTVISSGPLIRTGTNLVANHNAYFSLAAEPFDYYWSTASWAAWQGLGLDVDSTLTTAMPTGTSVFVRSNRYELGRAHVAIVNWASNAAVTVDLSGVGLTNGQSYRIRAVQDWTGPSVTNTYSGTESFPMVNWGLTQPRSRTLAMADGTWMAAHPTAVNVETSFPLVGVFVVEPLGAGEGEPDPDPPAATGVMRIYSF